MKKVVKQDASPASNSRRSSRDLSADNSRGKKVTRSENITPKKKTTTPNASPASSSRRSSASSRKQTKETPPTKMRKSVRLENMNSSDTPQSKRKKVVKSLDRSMTDTSKNKGQEKPSLGAGGRKRKRGRKMFFSRVKQKRSVADGDKGKDGEEMLSEAVTSSSGELVTELEKPDKLRQTDNNDKESEENSSEANSSSSRDVAMEDKTYSVSKSAEDEDDSDDECSDRKASKSQCGEEENNVKELLDDYLMDLDKTKHVGCPSNKSVDGKSIECGGGEGSSSESEKSPKKQKTNHGSRKQHELKYCDTSSTEDRTSCEAAGLAEIVEKIWDTRNVEVSDAQGLQKQKEYFVKYKGLAHIHNQWVPEARLLDDAPLLVESFSRSGSMKWSEDWTVPHKLLKKRLLLSLKPLNESQQNKGKVLNYHYEWLVQWQGLDYEQATWESDNISVLDSPEGHNLVKEYEKRQKNATMSSSSDDKIEEVPLKLPTLPSGCSPGMDDIHLSYIKNLHDAWNRGQISIVFDDQERTMRIALFIHSLNNVTLPFLLITTADSLSQWEAMFSKVASCNAFKIYTPGTEGKRSFNLVEVKKEGGQLAFQLLLYPVDAFVKDLNMLKAIQWQAVIVDESQNSEISLHFSRIKSLSTVKRLLVFCGPLGVSMTSYLDVLSKLDLDVISKTESDDMSKLKETLSNLIAYECKSNSSKFVEFRVPVQISNVQLEQYCSMLLSNAMALSSCSKTDTVGAVHDVLVSNRKCCDHPYIADQSLQGTLTKKLELAEFLDVGIKASGKLQFLDLILPELRKRKLRVLILYQPLSGSGKDSASIGDILDDFLRQRFGEDSYERIDAVGIVPSKKQAALNNFNNKDMGRFVFLLEYRACLPSIKLSSVDTIVIFNSEWNPANDLRALNKIAIDSQSEQIMIFRLYTSSTLEEKILRLAEHNVTIDSKLQNISRSTSDALLMWGATYLFNKLDEFHNASGVNTSSEECLLDELLEEFVNLITHVRMNKDATKLMITRAQPLCEINGKNPTVPNKIGGEQPHTFWRKLLVGRDPCWKYLDMSNPRQRKHRRPQYVEEPPEKISNDVSRKRKKTTNNITESVASKPVTEEKTTNNISESVASQPVTEEGEVVGANKSQSSADDSFWSDASATSFHDLLKLKISKLCEVLGLSVDVKTMVERFLEYVIENYHVNNEHTNTLQAFLISLCWSGSELLKHKLDRAQSVALANEHLNFSCNEEETRQLYLKLESAKEMFIRYTKNQKKTSVSEDSIPESEPTSVQLLEVKEEIPDSPTSQYNDDIVDCNHIDAEIGTINPDTSNALENQNDSHNLSNSSSPSAGASKENTPEVQCVVSPASGQSAPTDPEIQKETTQENEVQVNSSLLAETSYLLTVGAGKVDQLNQEGSSLQLGMGQCSTSATSPHVAEIQSTATSDEQRSGSYSADKMDCQPSNKPPSPSQNLLASSQVSETSAQVPNPAVTPRGSNLLNVQRRDNCNQGVSRPYSEPLQNELEKLCELKNNILKFHEIVKQKLKSDHEKELAEVIAEMNRKYEAKCQDAEAAFQSKRVEIDASYNKVVKNKMLADAYRSKSRDMSPFDPALLRVQSGGMQFQRQTSMGRSASFSPAQVSRIPQQQPLQIVHQSANVFSSTPTRTLPNTNPSQSTSIPSTTPTRSLHINPITSSTRPPSTSGPINTPSRPPPGVSPMTPSIRLNIPPLNINPITPSSRPPPPNINPITPSSRPPPSNIPTAAFTRNPRANSEVRAPAPHIRPFTPSTSTSHRMMSSHYASSPTSQSSTQPPRLSPLQTPPHLQTNHNGHFTHNSPSTHPFSSLLAAQTSSQSPAASLAVPPLYSRHPSELHPPGSLPAMSSSLSQTSLPPMPPISISNTGLYSASRGPLNLTLSALDLLMDIDKKAKLHQQPNTLASQREFSDATEIGKEGGSSDPVCLSDDD